MRKGCGGEKRMPITGVQVKAARRLLGWSQSKLAAETGVSEATIAKFESGKQKPAMLDLSVVHRMLKDAGVEFDGEGVAAIPKPSSARSAY
jgi:transcriptional regulator with XRE-family HTH domain